MHVSRAGTNENDMKKKSSEDLDDDLRPHYDFDFKKMRPNPYAHMDLKFKGLTVYLDDDVAEVFNSSESVNTVLRSAIRALRTAAPSARTSSKTQKVAAPKRKRASRKRHASELRKSS